MSEEAGVQRASIPITVLVVEDEEATRKLCADVAESCGMKALVAGTVEEALRCLESSAVDIVVTDLILPPSSGLDLLKQVHEMYPQVAVVVLTQYGTIDSAVAATRMGAVDYVTKPFHIEDLRARLERVARDMDLDRENRLLREQLRSKPGFGGMIGVSAKMQRVYKMIEKVSQHEYPVLILGESGTGKELVAKSIHYSGVRKERPFAPVDCSSLVPTLIESELFGYVKGAFTGAMQAKQGLLEAAQGGTLFLDEIGDMPVDLQAKLLRALQEREVKPVGSTERRHTISASSRPRIATSNRLSAAAPSGKTSISASTWCKSSCRRCASARATSSFWSPRFSKNSPIPRSAAHHFRRCHAPAPRLRLARQYARTGKRHGTRGRHGLRPHRSRGRSALEPALSEQRARSRKRRTAAHGRTRRRAILRALRETSGNKLAAARMLGIGKTTLYRKLKQYQMEQVEH